MSDSLNLVCPHCTAVNRIPANRIGDGPTCGKCRQPIFNGEPTELNTNSFKKQLTRNDIPVVVDFWAPWCGPCKMMAPAFKQATATLEPKVRLTKLNTEAEQSLSGQYNIRSIPTIVIFKNGKEIARQPGALSAPDIIKWISSHL